MRDKFNSNDWFADINHRDADGKDSREEVRNRNCFSDDWFNDGSYFSENGMVIYKADGTPVAYHDDCTNTFHSYVDGHMVLYYDLDGTQLWPAKLPRRTPNRA
jgi:hypothetical protein